MPTTREVTIPTEAEAAASGIDTVESIRAALVNLRTEAMKDWPDRIGETLVLSHALWWLSHLEQ